MRCLVRLVIALATVLATATAGSFAHANGQLTSTGKPVPQIHGAASFSPKTPPPSGAQAALMQARARAFQQRQIFAGGRLAYRTIPTSQHPPHIAAAVALMEREIEETEPMQVFAGTPGHTFSLVREADTDDHGPRNYHNGNYKQVRLNGYAGGPLTLDIAFPVSGHYGVNDYRNYARTNEYKIEVLHPSGLRETIAPIPTSAFGKSGPLAPGDYVTVGRLELVHGLERGETKIFMSPTATGVGGYPNGRTFGIFH